MKQIDETVEINWKRVGLYVIFLFLATALAAFPFGFFVAIFQIQGRPLPNWVVLGPPIAVPLAGVIVFVRLSMVQYTNTFLHIAVVALLTWLLSFPINVLLLKQPPRHWAASGVSLALPTLLGWLIGQYVQQRSMVHKAALDAPKKKETAMSQKQLAPHELLLSILGMIIGIVLAISVTILFLPRNIILFMAAGAIGGAGGSFLGGSLSKK